MGAPVLLSVHEILLKVGEVFRHCDTLFLALHECSEALGTLNVDAENLVNLLLELGRMGCFTEDTDLTILESVNKCLIAAGTMRIKNVARLLIALAHRGTNLFVAIGGTVDQIGDAMMGGHIRQLAVLAVEIEDTGEVGWIAYVHGIGKGLDRGLGTVLACLQIVVEHIIGIVGSNEAFDGQSHLMAEERSTDVAEVA